MWKMSLLYAMSYFIVESFNCFGKKPVQVGKCYTFLSFLWYGLIGSFYVIKIIAIIMTTVYFFQWFV